jgi:hypothetical protein
VSTSARFQTGREVPQEGRFVTELQPLDPGTFAPDFKNDLDHIINVALRIDAPGNSETDEIHLGRGPKHKRTDLG